MGNVSYELFFTCILATTFIRYNLPVSGEKEVRYSCTHAKRFEIERHLSTRTPYRVLANLDDNSKEFPGCKAKRIWTIIRHGTRNPSKNMIKEAKVELTNLKNRIINNSYSILCDEDLERLRYWRFNVSEAEQKYLVAEGEDELIELAERMQNRFPKLLADEYDPKLYYFKYTATQRTEKSALSFATGLFGRHRIGSIEYPEAEIKDPVLRAFVSA